MVCASVLCAETDDRARWLAGPAKLAFLRLRGGRPGVLPTPEEAAAYPYSALEEQILDERMSSQVVGSPDTVARGVGELLERTGANELMITCMTHDNADRVRSYELIAEAFALEGRSAVAV